MEVDLHSAYDMLMMTIMMMMIIMIIMMMMMIDVTQPICTF